jgi:hypothetical protein
MARHAPRRGLSLSSKSPIVKGKKIKGRGMARTIDYGNLMHRAMRGLIQEVLEDVQQNGLPGAHHFFITFDTNHPDAVLAEWLKRRYPAEMTVVMQHWYDNLEVSDEGFAITLNFGDAPENLYVPYDAIQTFVDPSVEFGLRFEKQATEADESAQDTGDENAANETAGDGKTDTDEPKTKADIVSLDSFRKH